MPAKRDADEATVQLATRVPAALLRRVKLRCIVNNTTVMQFVADAIRAKLKRGGRKLAMLATLFAA